MPPNRHEAITNILKTLQTNDNAGRPGSDYNEELKNVELMLRLPTHVRKIDSTKEAEIFKKIDERMATFDRALVDDIRMLLVAKQKLYQEAKSSQEY